MFPDYDTSSHARFKPVQVILSLSLIRLLPGLLSWGLARWYYQLAASCIISLWGQIRSTKILSTIQFIVLCLLKPSVGSVDPQFCLVHAVTEVSISIVLLYTVLYSPMPQWLGFVQIVAVHALILTHYLLNPYRIHTCFTPLNLLCHPCHCWLCITMSVKLTNDRLQDWVQKSSHIRVWSTWVRKPIMVWKPASRWKTTRDQEPTGHILAITPQLGCCTVLL
jgi:hypothetical protein